jgi:hypothetical protein|eukprot:COSAG01_NODE_1393_length_10480_cov_173.085717_16_plen_43_part_00
MILGRVGPPGLTALTIPSAELVWLCGFVLQERVLRCGSALTL